MAVTKIIIEEGHKMCVAVRTKEEFLADRGSAEQKARFKAVREGNEGEKNHLIQYNYTLLPPKEKCALKGYNCVGDSFGHDIDCHDKAESDKIAQKILAMKDELKLLMLERTAHYGLHSVHRREPGKTILESQVAVAMKIDAEMDTNTKDLQRVWYASTDDRDELLFLDDSLFECNMTEEEAEAEYQLLHQRSARKEDDVPPEARKSNKHYKPSPLTPNGGTLYTIEGLKEGTEQTNVSNTPPSGAGGLYLGIPYSTIIAKYWEMFNEGQEPTEGNRNVLTYELAMTLRGICEYDMDKMLQVIPNYWISSTNGGGQEGVSEWRRTIQNAVNEPRKGMPYRLRQVLKAVKDERRLKAIAHGIDGSNADNPNETKDAGMPQRPKRMPGFLSLISSKVPHKIKPMVEEACWPALCAHLRGVTFRYVDGVIHEANISELTIDRQSSGKGHKNQPIEYLLADITARDLENDARLKDWRRRNQGKASSKDRQPRPEDICIQRLDDDLTPAALAQALIDADANGGKRIITKVDEVEMLNKVGNGRNDTVGLLVRYGFDSQKFGQRRVGLDSVNGSYTVRWVWNASCTPKSARKFITSDWIANGSLSRLNINSLLLPKDDHEMAKIGEYDEKYANDIRIYIDRLNAASGLIECPQANKLAQEMINEHNKIADLCESEGYRTFSYRAIVIGWLKANLLYIAHGYRWDKGIAEYVRYSVRRDMYLKMYFFGKQIEDEFEEEERQTHSGPQNMLALLPDEFTFETYVQLRQQQGRRGDGKGTLRMWKSRGYIDFDDVTETYRKLNN